MNIPAGSGSKSRTEATAVKLIGPKMCGNLSESEMPGAGDPAGGSHFNSGLSCASSSFNKKRSFCPR